MDSRAPETGSAPTTIQLLVSERGDRDALRDILADRYSVVTEPTLQAVDCYLVDDRKLPDYAEEIRAQKRDRRPVFVPVLVIRRESVPLEVGARDDQGEEVVLLDEVISAPVGSGTLIRRLENLLARRQQSLELASRYEDVQARFRRLFDASNDAILVVDPTGDGIVEANPTASDLLGYPIEELRGLAVDRLLPAEEGAAYESFVAEVMAAGTGERDEVAVETRSGDRRILELSGARVDYEGQDTMIVSARDITERKRSERSLRGYKQAVESARDLLAAVDTDMNLVFANEAYAEYHDVDRVDVVGRSLPAVIGADRFAEVESAVRAALDGERSALEIERTHPKMGPRILDANLYPITDGDGTIQGAGASMRDVTAQKAYESELERYRELVTHSPAGIFRASLSDGGELREANPKLVDLFDADSAADLIGRPVAEFFADQDQVDAVLEDLELTGVTSVEAQFRTLADATFWAKGVAIRRETATGEAFIEGIIIDITERKRRERELETLISNLPGIVYRCRNETGWPMEMVRGQSEALSGYPAEALETGEVSWGADVIHLEDREPVWEAVQTAIEHDEAYELTYRIRTEDGEVRWAWERGQLVTPVTAEDQRLEGFITDITERKELQQDLKAAKEDYESLFNSIRDAILVADTDRCIINCNRAFTDLFGYELHEIEGQPTKVVYASEEEFEAMGEAIQGHIGDPNFTITVQYEKASGQVFPGETNIFYRIDADGEITGFIGVIRDVSDRRDRMQQLRIIDRVLQHKFHNDMNVIEGNATLAKEAGGERVASYIETVLATGKDLRHTVDKEREITKFLADQPPLATIEVRSTVEASVARLDTDATGARITVSGAEEVHALANVAISQAVEELVHNAVVHSESERPTVEVTIREQPDGVSIEVADEGPVIPEMERKVLVGEAELGPLYHGSGLGLWLVQLIVENSEGWLEFDQTASGGNRVTIHLLRASAAPKVDGPG